MNNRILIGDARERLLELPDESVQCCVTSPPYWGLRDYGCTGQIGLERTPEEYVEQMVGVFREVRRTLRADGTLWLNLGDCYATGAGKVGECPGGGAQGARWAGYRGDRTAAQAGKHAAVVESMGPMTQPNRMPIPGLKPKDLVGIPWRVAFALQADGWWLRMDNVWSKPNPMPESVTDRPTKAHEYVFLLAKSERYFYDSDAVREPAVRKSSANVARKVAVAGERDRTNTHLGSSIPWTNDGTGRNRRSVWHIATKSFPGAHFAVMPEALAEPCVLAGSDQGDTVLDPFAGSGTVGVVALKHGRGFIGIELNPKYAQLAEERIGSDLFNRVEVAA